MGGQALADGCGAAILPRDRCSQRLVVAPVPRQNGLTLIGHAHGTDRRSRPGKRLTPRLQHGSEEFLGILLDGAVAECPRMHRRFSSAENASLRRQHQRFGR